MKLKDLFSVPDDQRVSEKQMLRVLICTVCSILVCMSCMVGSAWAWFTVSVENSGNAIQIASVETQLAVTKGGSSVAPETNGSYKLSKGTYAVTVSAATDSSAENSKLYAILAIDGLPVGYTALTGESGASTLAASGQTKVYKSEITIQAGKACSFSCMVSWLKPENSTLITDGKITVGTLAPEPAWNMHISFDDVANCFANLKNKSYKSLYEEPFFGWLKGLHDTYGAKFSLYAYYNDLVGVPSTYAAEFAAASDWLKIGLHADHSGNSTGFTTYEQGKTAWNTFVGYVKTITGTTDSIDRMPRLHYFAGSQAALEGMQDAECGALGFLAADDNRNSYYFSSAVSEALYNSNHITDLNNGLVFLNTDMRGDWFKDGWTTTNQYRQPTKATVYEELAYRYGASEYDAMLGWCVFFSHEWQFYDGTTLGAGRTWTEDACRFAYDQGIAFGYPQDRSFASTENDIPLDDGTTTVFNGDTLKIVDDFGEVQFVSGYTLNGSGLQYQQLASRALSKTEVLKVSHSLRTLSLDLTKLSIKDQLHYTVYQFKGLPLDSSNFTGGGSWSQADLTLSDSTQYVIIIFKNGNEEAFSDADLALLNQCVQFK